MIGMIREGNPFTKAFGKLASLKALWLKCIMLNIHKILLLLGKVIRVRVTIFIESSQLRIPYRVVL